MNYNAEFIGDRCKKSPDLTEKWILSHLCLLVCSCAIDVWSRSSFRVIKYCAGFLGADVGKTINRVLKTHLIVLQIVIKLTFVANSLDFFIRYEAVWLISMIRASKWRLKCPKNFRPPPWILPKICMFYTILTYIQLLFHPQCKNIQLVP